VKSAFKAIFKSLSMPRTAKAKTPSRNAASPDVWAEILSTIKLKADPLSFKTWLGPSRLMPSSNGKLRVQLPNQEFIEYVSAKWLHEILQEAKKKGFPKVEFFPELPESQLAPEDQPIAPEAVQGVISPSGAPVLPEAAWPELAQSYREAIARTTNAPDSFHLASFLAWTGAAIGRRVFTTISEVVYPTLFVVLVGASGLSRKGTSMKKAMRAVKAAVPSIEMFTSIDSAEGLIKTLTPIQGRDIEASQRKAAMFHFSEMRTFLNKAAKKGMENTIPRLCEALDGDRLESRSLMSPGCIPEPFIAAAAGSSKPYVKAFNRDDLEGGLGRRLVFVYGEPKKRMAKPPAPAEPFYANTIRGLRAAVQHWEINGPFELSMSKTADAMWVCFFEEELPKYVPADDFLAVLANGADQCCLKVALIAAALDRSKLIEERHMRTGIDFAKYAVDCLRFVFDDYDVPRWVRDERKILEAVQKRNGGMRRRSLQHNFKRMGAEEFNRHVKALIESRMLHEEMDETGRKVLYFVEE